MVEKAVGEIKERRLGNFYREEKEEYMEGCEKRKRGKSTEFEL